MRVRLSIGTRRTLDTRPRITDSLGRQGEIERAIIVNALRNVHVALFLPVAHQYPYVKHVLSIFVGL
jgi:hypothetical protein